VGSASVLGTCAVLSAAGCPPRQRVRPGQFGVRALLAAGVDLRTWWCCCSRVCAGAWRRVMPWLGWALVFFPAAYCGGAAVVRLGSIGIELLTDPSILFLDEPTSGV
jgi:hypothetical protein